MNLKFREIWVKLLELHAIRRASSKHPEAHEAFELAYKERRRLQRDKKIRICIIGGIIVTAVVLFLFKLF